MPFLVFTKMPMSVSPITPEDIECEISGKTGKAVGPGISVSILKILKGASSEPLQIILNTSVLTGIVLEKYKLTRVIA